MVVTRLSPEKVTQHLYQRRRQGNASHIQVEDYLPFTEESSQSFYLKSSASTNNRPLLKTKVRKIIS